MQMGTPFRHFDPPVASKLAGDRCKASCLAVFHCCGSTHFGQAKSRGEEIPWTVSMSAISGRGPCLAIRHE